MRALLALLLTLVLSLASQTEAVAHAEMAGATLTSSCAQGMILMDATGKPLAHRPCTHCLAASVAALLPEAPAVDRPQTAARALSPIPAGTGEGRAEPPASARGPPSLV